MSKDNRREELAAEKKYLKSFLPNRNLKVELSDFKNCVKIKWGEEFIHLNPQDLSPKMLTTLGGMDDDFGVIKTCLLPIQLDDGSKAFGMHFSWDKEEFFAWLPDTPDYRKRLSYLANSEIFSKLMLSFRNEEDVDIDTVREFVEDEIPDAQILEFGEVPDELESFETSTGIWDTLTPILQAVGLKTSAMKSSTPTVRPQAKNSEVSQESVDDFERILSKLEAEKKAKAEKRRQPKKQNQPRNVKQSGAD